MESWRRCAASLEEDAAQEAAHHRILEAVFFMAIAPLYYAKLSKANGFLLLYNLIESTLKNAIEAIFDEFKLKGVSFDQCRLEVRQLILKNLKRHDEKRLLLA